MNFLLDLISKYTLIYPGFCATIFFTLLKVQSRFKQAAVVWLPFQVIVSSPKQAADVLTPVYLFPANILPSSKRSNIFWSDPSFTFVYNPLFPINK